MAKELNRSRGNPPARRRGNRAGSAVSYVEQRGNLRLVALDERGVTFRWKEYRAKGRTRYKTMTLGADEFMRPFLLHVLPGGFHCIRHYGLLANAARRQTLVRACAVARRACGRSTARCRGAGRPRPTDYRLPALRRTDVPC
ncbi:hypothetical protein CS8_093980 [Cupriavidus sp. 8B]